MSLSKPFPLQKLPRLAFEHVLHQMYPLDLFWLSSIPSTKLVNRIKMAQLASSHEIDIRMENATISILMRSGDTFTWAIVEHYEATIYQRDWYPECILEGGPSVVVVNDSLRLENYKCTSTDTIYSEAFLTGSEPLEVPLFTQLLSKFPCPVEAVHLDCENYEFIDDFIFNWKTIKTCKELYITRHIDNYFLEVLATLKVTDKVMIESRQLEKEEEEEKEEEDRFYSYWLKDYRILVLKNVENYSSFAFNRQSNHEHFFIEDGSLPVESLIQYFRNWQTGDHRRLKTFFYSSKGVVDLFPILRHLKKESSMPENSPRLVKCCYHYIDSTIASESQFKTVLIKNCHGDLATLIIYDYPGEVTARIHFAVWDYSNTQIEIPKGYRMTRWHWFDGNCPIYAIRSRIPEIFEDEDYIRLDRHGLVTLQQYAQRGEMYPFETI